MGINSDIKGYINYNILDSGIAEKIKQYLDDASTDKAKKLFDSLGERYEKEYCFSDLLEKLNKYEEKIGSLLLNYRNHYKHSANVFCLGLALYSKCDILNDFLNRIPDMQEQASEKFLLRWSIAACLHDVAYPLQMSIRNFTELISEHNKKSELGFLKINFDVIDSLNIIPILPYYFSMKDFSGGNHNIKRYIKTLLKKDYMQDTGLKLIANCLTNTSARENVPTILTCNTMHEILCSYVKHCFEKGIVDHGLFGALIILKELSELYKKKINSDSDWLIKDFYYHIVESATAIFLHTTYENLFLTESCLGYGKFKIESPSPLGCLLTLCDHLSEWDKEVTNPESNIPKGLTKCLKEEIFSLKIIGNSIKLKVPHYEYKKKDKHKYGKCDTYAKELKTEIKNIFDLNELTIKISGR